MGRSRNKENVWKNYAAAKLPTYNCNGKKVQMSTYFGYKMLGVNPYSKIRSGHISLHAIFQMKKIRNSDLK